jgi:hypothetical protein
MFSASCDTAGPTIARTVEPNSELSISQAPFIVVLNLEFLNASCKKVCLYSNLIGEINLSVTFNEPRLANAEPV